MYFFKKCSKSERDADHGILTWGDDPRPVCIPFVVRERDCPGPDFLCGDHVLRTKKEDCLTPGGHTGLFPSFATCLHGAGETGVHPSVTPHGWCYLCASENKSLNGSCCLHSIPLCLHLRVNYDCVDFGLCSWVMHLRTGARAGLPGPRALLVAQDVLS